MVRRFGPKRLDEKFTDVFAVQDAISQKVADALALRLSGEEKSRLTKRYTENLEAYQLYLTGRYHYTKLIPREIRTAVDFFQQAIERDPNYAMAYFGWRKRIAHSQFPATCRRKKHCRAQMKQP